LCYQKFGRFFKKKKKQKRNFIELTTLLKKIQQLPKKKKLKEKDTANSHYKRIKISRNIKRISKAERK
jgi:hypothetical protein